MLKLWIYMISMGLFIGALIGIMKEIEFRLKKKNYVEVYLKSIEWKKKRALVLKRDNYKCVLCENRATQVHHKKYARYNIGKEPIEWLISVCDVCHNKLSVTKK